MACESLLNELWTDLRERGRSSTPRKGAIWNSSSSHEEPLFPPSRPSTFNNLLFETSYRETRVFLLLKFRAYDRKIVRLRYTFLTLAMIRILFSPFLLLLFFRTKIYNFLRIVAMRSVFRFTFDSRTFIVGKLSKVRGWATKKILILWDGNIWIGKLWKSSLRGYYYYLVEISTRKMVTCCGTFWNFIDTDRKIDNDVDGESCWKKFRASQSR